MELLSTRLSWLFRLQFVQNCVCIHLERLRSPSRDVAVVQGIFEVSLWSLPLGPLAHFAEDFYADGIHP